MGSAGAQAPEVARTHTPPHVLHIDAEARLAVRNVSNRRRADMIETWLNGATVLLRHTRDRRHTYHDVDHWWLIVDGTAVAYLHTMTYLTYDTYRFILCDIEVRDTHRGHGHARRIIEATNDQQGDILHTTGGFTPLGAQALSWVPLVPGSQPGTHYDDMAFVADWDTLTAINPL